MTMSLTRRALGRFGVPAKFLDDRYDLNQVQAFEFALRRSGRSLSDCRSILDFGCGDGRLLAHLVRLAPAASICGVDVLPAAVARCRRRFPRCRFEVGPVTPPLRLDGDGFDLILSYSVFTHLSEANHKAWLEELAGLLRPGGVMAHTIHSMTAIERMRWSSPANLEKYALPLTIPEYHYAISDPGRPEYGVTIIRREYVERHWPTYSGLDVLAYAEAAVESYPEGCHDIVVLGRGRAGTD
jgi:cyclopropane fatty-acyl-phospholipid synthase-like methyltransferase